MAYGFGCKCPILDNRHGEGYQPGKLWIIARACPLHGKLKSVLGEETLARLQAFQESLRQGL